MAEDQDGFRMSVDLRNSSDRLWFHALQFLDDYRLTNAHVDKGSLYSVENEILEKHRRMLAPKFQNGDADMREMYIELIKLIFAEEEEASPDSYEHTLDIHKLQGYQELTNRLQRSLNLKLFQQLEEQAKAIERLEGMLKDRDLVDSSALILQKNNIEVLEQRIDQNEEHFRLLERRDQAQDDDIDDVRKEIKELKDKDKYLEQSNTMAQNKIKDLEATTADLEVTLKKEMKELNDDLEDLEDSLNSCTKKVHELKDKDDEQQGQLDMHNERLRALEGSLNDKVNGLRQEDEHLHQRIDEMKDTLVNVKVEVQAREEQDQTPQLEEAIAKLADKCKELEGITNENHEVIGNYTVNQLTFRDAMNNDLQLLRLDHQGKLDMLEKKLDEDIEDGQKLKIRVDEIRPEYQDHVKASLEPVNEELDLLKAALKNKDDQIATALALKIDIEDIRGKESQIEKGYDEAIGRLEADLQKQGVELQQQQHNHNSLVQDVHAKGDLIEALHKRDNEQQGLIDSNTEAIKSLEGFLNGTNVRVNELDDNNNNLARKTSSLEEDLRNDKLLIDNLNNAKNDLQNNLKTVEDRSLDNLESIVALKEYTNNKAEEATQLQISIQQIEAEKQQSAAQLQTDLDDQLAKLRVEVDDHSKTLGELRAADDNLLRANQAVITQLAQTDRRLLDLDGKVGEMGNELKEIRTNHRDDIEKLVEEDQAIWKKVDEIATGNLHLASFTELIAQIKQDLEHSDARHSQKLEALRAELRADDKDLEKKLAELVVELTNMKTDLDDFDEKNKLLLQDLMDDDKRLNTKIGEIEGRLRLLDELRVSFGDTEAKLREELALTIQLALNTGKDENADRFKEFQDSIDDKIHELGLLTDKNNKHVDNLRELNEKLLEEIKNTVVNDVDELKQARDRTSDDLVQLNVKLGGLDDQVRHMQTTQQELLVGIVEQQTNVLKVSLKQEMEQQVHSVDDRVEERLAKAEGNIDDLGRRVDELEKAETYLQEGHKAAMNRIHDVEEDAKKTKVDVDRLEVNLKSLKGEVEENNRHLKEDLQRQVDEDQALWKKMEDLAEVDVKISQKLDADISEIKADITDFDEKNKVLIQGLMDEDQAIQNKIDAIDGSFKGLDVKITAINDEGKKDILKTLDEKIVILEDLGKHNDAGLQGLQLSIDNLTTDVDHKIDVVKHQNEEEVKKLQKVIEDVADNEHKLEKALEVIKPEIVQVVENQLQGKIELVVEEKVAPVLAQEVAVAEKLHAIEGVIEEVKDDVKEKDFEIEKKADELAVRIEAVVVKEQEVEGKNDKIEDDVKALQLKLDQMIFGYTEKLEDLADQVKDTDELDALKVKLEDLRASTGNQFEDVHKKREDLNKALDGRINQNLENIINLQEEANNKQVEVNHQFQLNFARLEEAKQQSDADHRSDLERLQNELKVRVDGHDERLRIHDQKLLALSQDNSLAKRVDDLEEAKHSLQEEQVIMNNEVKKHDQRMDGLKMEIKHCEEELDSLEKNLKKDIQTLVEEDQAIWQKIDTLDKQDQKLSEQCQDNLSQLLKVHDDITALQELIAKLKDKMKEDMIVDVNLAITKLKEGDEEELQRLRDQIDDKIAEVDKHCDKNSKHVENLRGLNTTLLDEIKKQVGVDVDALKDAREVMQEEMSALLLRLKNLEKDMKDLEGKEKEEALNLVLEQTNILKEAMNRELKLQIGVVDEGFSERLVVAETDIKGLKAGHNDNKSALGDLRVALQTVDEARTEGDKDLAKAAAKLRENIAALSGASRLSTAESQHAASWREDTILRRSHVTLTGAAAAPAADSAAREPRKSRPEQALQSPEDISVATTTQQQQPGPAMPLTSTRHGSGGGLSLWFMKKRHSGGALRPPPCGCCGSPGTPGCCPSPGRYRPSSSPPYERKRDKRRGSRRRKESEDRTQYSLTSMETLETLETLDDSASSPPPQRAPAEPGPAPVQRIETHSIRI